MTQAADETTDVVSVATRPLMSVAGMSKRFGDLAVIKDVSLEVFPGEVLGLAGQSGAGKSVVAKLLAGLLAPDAGSVHFDGKRLVWPFAAQAFGIEFIAQRPELVEMMDITSNIFLGHEAEWSRGGRWLSIPDRARMDEEASRVLADLGLHVTSLSDKAANLSSEQRQIVAIAKVMCHANRLVIIDEPTELLSYPYQQRLMALIQTWRQQGVAIVFGSKELEHLFAVTDRIAVLRDGSCVATRRTDETTRDELVSDLLGATDLEHLTPALWALDSFRTARDQADGLSQQQEMLERSLEAQGTLNQQLVEQLGRQVKSLDQANLALQDAQRRLLTEREQERKHLARELHDDVIQDLLSVNYELGDITDDTAVGATLKADLGDISESIRELVVDLRRICGDLRPPTIDSLGMSAAVQSYSQLWSERSGITVDFDPSPDLRRLPEAIELSVFRIVQEGLRNIRKHAQATAVEIRLFHTSPRKLMISVADDGRGLPADFDLSRLAAQGHYGLLGLSERVALLGGRLHFQNRRDGGLLLEVEIPHPRVEPVVPTGLN
jgi:signal transduction histidine kinase